MAKDSADKRTAEIPAVCNPLFRSKITPRVRVFSDVSGKSMTKQSFKDECDINVIMKRYQDNGVMPFAEAREPRFVDATAADFQEAMFMVADARSAFMDMPSGLRARFKNDPAELLAFLEDDRNREEAISLGLVRPQEAPEPPVEVRVIPDPVKAPGAA